VRAQGLDHSAGDAVIVFHDQDMHHTRVPSGRSSAEALDSTGKGRERARGVPGMASIEEVRAGIALANDKASESIGALQQAHSSLEQAQGALLRVTEGSAQADVSDANALLANAVGSILEVQQAVAAAIQAAEGVANRL
jgi:hypothetical protein